MGNFLLWRGTLGNSIPADGLFTTVIESSLASDLQARINAALAEFRDTSHLADVCLSGAGDGHAFICSLLWAPDSSTDAGLRAVCYSGASEPALRDAANAAIAGLVESGELFIYGQAESGAKQGTRFMGVLLASTTD